VKVYTLLTTTNRFGLPAFVRACKALNASGVTVFSTPQSFAPDPQTATRIQNQITDLSKKESNAAQIRDYVLASQIRGEISDLEATMKNLHDQAAAYYVQETQPIQTILATIVLDRESWEGDTLVSEETFTNQIAHISNRLLTAGIRGSKHVTPLHLRTYIPLGSLEFSHSQPVAQVAVVPMATDSVVGDFSQSETPPSGLQAVEEPSEFITDTLDDDGLPDSLSPNQKSFVQAIIRKEATNFAQASNVAGLSPSSTKKVITDITKKWPEFPRFIAEFIKVTDAE
jgi:lambda repressor-like predicted transcriptional regulator